MEQLQRTWSGSAGLAPCPSFSHTWERRNSPTETAFQRHGRSLAQIQLKHDKFCLDQQCLSRSQLGISHTAKKKVKSAFQPLCWGAGSYSGGVIALGRSDMSCGRLYQYLKAPVPRTMTGLQSEILVFILRSELYSDSQPFLGWTFDFSRIICSKEDMAGNTMVVFNRIFLVDLLWIQLPNWHKCLNETVNSFQV